MADIQVCVGVAFVTYHESYNNILKFGTPYAEHSVYHEQLIE
jgi:hypothetical protein